MIYQYKQHQLRYNVGGDLDGFPVFINYGLIGDIDLTELGQLALAQGLKLIILERPGYGESDFIEMQDYTAWADIVGGLLEYLKIDEFSVVGISAGAPYSYALLNQFAERIKGIYILSGIPFVIDTEVLDKYNDKDRAFYQKIWHYSQAEIQEEMYAQLKKYDNFFVKLILPKSVKRDFQSSLANNCSGMGQTVRLQTQDWGFDVYNFTEKIYLWHSDKDKEVPFAPVKVMVDKMRNAELYVKGDDHIPSKELTIEVFTKIKSDV